MASASEKSLAVRVLYDSANVTISDYTCRAPRSGPATEEHPDDNSIVLLRRGVFRKHRGRHAVTADTNQAVFFVQGSSYQVSHPVGSGNRGTIFSAPSDTLVDLVSDHDLAAADDPCRPFPFMSGPCTRRVFWRHRELLQRLERTAGSDPDPMWVEETSLDLMADVLTSAFALRAEPRKRRRRRTVADHAERIEVAKSFLASRMKEPLSLNDVARHVGLSPYHMARIFREHAGVPVHRYLTRLRLRDAVERLADGVEDLTNLALELGYASHSHFTDAFGREFGRPPSVVRADLKAGVLPEASKIPEA